MKILSTKSILLMLLALSVGGFTKATLAGGAPGSDIELARKILQDERMDAVLKMVDAGQPTDGRE